MFRPARQRYPKAGQPAEHEHHREYQNQGFVAPEQLWRSTSLLILVCTENLNPHVMVMKSAEDLVRFDISSPLNRARDRRIFVQ
jgi:hypothetical protein